MGNIERADALPDTITRKVCAECGALPPCVEHYERAGIRTVEYVRADASRGAVEFIERIANHPSGTTRTGREAMRERAREWLADHHPTGGQS